MTWNGVKTYVLSNSTTVT